MNVCGLVQLCQVAQPVGGYSDSFRVEELVRQRRLTSAAELLDFLINVLRAAIAPADGIASGVAFRAARAGEIERIPELCAALDSEKVPRAMRLASHQMGQRLWILSRNWDWACGVHEQLDPLAARTNLPHAVAFGALVSETTNSQVRAIATYLFNTARNIVQSAVRAIPLNESQGQRVLSDVQPAIAELAARCVDKPPAEISTLTGADDLRSLLP